MNNIIHTVFNGVVIVKMRENQINDITVDSVIEELKKQNLKIRMNLVTNKIEFTVDMTKE